MNHTTRCLTTVDSYNGDQPGHGSVTLLRLMSRSGNSGLLVTEGDRLVGIGTMRDLMNFKKAKLDLEGGEAVDLRYTEVATRDREQAAGLRGGSELNQGQLRRRSPRHRRCAAVPERGIGRGG